MLNLGVIGFAAPWLLLALAGLPILWWLLRAAPPTPRLIPFPAIRLLFGLNPTDETPDRTPWWLLLLRLIIAALVIVALARPLLNPVTGPEARGPALVVVDDGWAAAKNWPDRVDAINLAIDQADRASRPVILITTAPTADQSPLVSGLLPADDARQHALALRPKPWAVDRRTALDQLNAITIEGSASVTWVGDGFDNGAATVLARRLQQIGPVTLLGDAPGQDPVVIAPADTPDLSIVLRRLSTEVPGSFDISALADDGQLLGRQSVVVPAGETAQQVLIELPGELRNRTAQLRVEGENTAAAVILLDERFRRRPVGLASGDTPDVDQPLLGDLYYIDRALGPFTDVRRGTVETLLDRRLAMLILADIGTLTGDETARLEDWIAAGGVLVRFAGPRLAEGSDPLLPVALRRGGRTFGGVMTWQRAARIAPFTADSPFAGLAIPPDIEVRQQVLAEPSPDLAGKIWARLEDGTPLVTAERRDNGWLVLVHTTANTAWSNLSLSGLYVDMLRRLIDLSQGVANLDSTVRLQPHTLLDGFGRQVAPGNTRAVAAADLAGAQPGPVTPPGFYGTDTARQALNLGPSIADLQPIPAVSGVARATYGPTGQIDVRPWLLLLAFLLFLADFLIGLGLRGLLPIARRAVPVAVLGFVVAALPPDGLAQSSAVQLELEAIAATSETHLAYVVTGDRRTDQISREGLTGLGQALRSRTSVEPGDPVGVNLARDELSFYPLIYWPMTDTQGALNDNTRRRLNAYMRNGGTILFDTRDQQLAGLGGVGPGTQRLRQLVDGLDVPAVVPVPPNHVLTKAFYLLQDFPGRWAAGALWVQRPDDRVNDGVSPIIIGSNDYAAAWAADDFSRPLYPVVPGGERQREMATRFGINLVMYALTGNYKADQVHVPAILERLGQ